MELSLANYGALTSWRDVDKLDARPGDKVEFDRGIYKHVGIADGEGGVYHFNGEPTNKAGAIYRYDKLQKVAGNDKVRVNNTEDKRRPPLPRQEIVKRAEKAVGTGRGEYNLTRNNCEHRATEMCYGEPVSEQVSTWEKVGWGIGIGALVVGSLAGLCYALSDSNRQDSDEEDE